MGKMAFFGLVAVGVFFVLDSIIYRKIYMYGVAGTYHIALDLDKHK